MSHYPGFGLIPWLLAGAALSACAPAPDGAVAGASALDPEIQIVVDADEQLQHIVGFGASSAWTGQNIGAYMADQFFSTDMGIGLSLLRLRIAPDGTTWEMPTAQLAQQRGASVWAAPWSPPGAWKTSGTDNNGGSLLPEYYDDWADRLADFVLATEQAGVDLLAISAQNEPDWVADWETCEWTPEELATFIRDHLRPALDERGLDTRLLAPESANWNSFASYSDAILDDEIARDAIDVVAVHSYGGSAFSYAKPAQHGKELWQTEVSDSNAPDDGMGSALQMAQMMHTHLTVSNVNAWHYWWLMPSSVISTTNSSLVNSGEMTRRGYALGNYSRFVRPGAHRIAATPASAGVGVRVTAFKNAGEGPFVIVALNATGSAELVRFRFEGAAVPAVTPWLTDSASALVAQDVVDVTEWFDYELPPASVITFVGTDAPTPGGEGGMGGAEPAPAAGAAGSENSAGSGGSGAAGGSSFPGDKGGGGGGGASPGAAGSTDQEPLRPTPSVACLCRTPGGAPATSTGAWVGLTSLLAAWLLRQRERRSHSTNRAARS